MFGNAMPVIVRSLWGGPRYRCLRTYILEVGEKLKLEVYWVIGNYM
jgi:hypothetical protein